MVECKIKPRIENNIGGVSNIGMEKDSGSDTSYKATVS